MAEAAFAKTFLSTLDSRPMKLSADHVEDAKSFPARPPYILSRMPTSMSKPKTLLPGQERSLTVTLKSLRNPPLDIKLTSQPLNTSILYIKTKVSEQTRIPIDKMKILHNKRPLTDSKILKDVVSESDLRVDFSVMVIGGAAAIQPGLKEEAVAGASGLDALTTDAFWTDLNGFLEKRLRDQVVAGELGQLFKTSWESSRSGP